MDVKVQLQKCLDQLSSEARELYIDSTVTEIDEAPSPLQFYRDFVAPNKPVLIKNAIDHWPALKKWTPEYLRDKIGDQEVTVAVTPNGYADAVTDGKFVMPEERMMKLSQFLDILDKPESAKGVFYVQKQNSNLTDEFVSVMEDVDPEIKWGSDAFGKAPDAVNFWMGDKRAVTSMHRDHYENLYCVVRGWKKFLLIPPTDLPSVPYELFPAAVFQENDKGQFMIVDDDKTGQVPWVAIDPLNPDYNKFPQYRNAKPIEVTVHAGQMLYLPSLWFHHVQQSHGCIAVNYWYDMEFDIKYNYYKCIESLVDIVK
ncbi:bifunctional peptidase and (3S)-lysyl hydroxylase Jmjd7-like isoform X2 [Ruditapes philippinarum]|uniref:bifunctional peptidase and (3S)-lysyl hydroxylase Jmjd7-like isoform X2 n=1 Tax=Ruditapes philippinarum TaxID=129788 RepID=UPI00295A9B9A|nr:bifunctional peptidase and (3S)-lysyl hydroxylase Jmjd7-like isoform X2 [Ruditapes philippinarum]